MGTLLDLCQDVLAAESQNPPGALEMDRIRAVLGETLTDATPSSLSREIKGCYYILRSALSALNMGFNVSDKIRQAKLYNSIMDESNT